MTKQTKILRKYIKLYIPQTDSLDATRRQAVAKLTELAGGTTTHSGWGTWVNDEGEVEAESVMIVTAFVANDQIFDAFRLTHEIADAMFEAGEKVVVFESDGELTFLEPDPVKEAEDG